jgi:hypothetical protein
MKKRKNSGIVTAAEKAALAEILKTCEELGISVWTYRRMMYNLPVINFPKS